MLCDLNLPASPWLKSALCHLHRTCGEHRQARATPAGEQQHCTLSIAAGPFQQEGLRFPE